MDREYWPTMEWRTEEPAVLGMDLERLSAIEPIIQSEYGNINGIVVVRNGYIAYERYFNGCGPDDTHHMTSVTKSIVSALIGIAIDAGYIENADQNVLDFFPEYDAADSRKREITIRHLLTMTVPYPFEDWHEPLDKMCMQSDWVAYILDIIGQGGAIGAFKYATAGAHLLSAVITRSTGKNARAFANERLFNPLGMGVIPDYGMESFAFEDLFGAKVKGWVEDPGGNNTGGWGLTLTPRDMARFGFLYLNHGTWADKQIVSEQWVRASTAINANRYGYLWWLHADGFFSYQAVGDGGNVICCIPEKDLVIAIASEFMLNPRDRRPLIEEYIVPAVIG